jgi:hypothetical protein
MSMQVRGQGMANREWSNAASAAALSYSLFPIPYSPLRRSDA